MKLPEKPNFNWREYINTKSLNELTQITNISILNKIKRYDREYYYWSDLIYRIKDEDERKVVWTVIKISRETRYETVPYTPIKLKYCSTSNISKQLHLFDKELAGNIRSQTESLGLEKKYIISSLMEEAIASSMLEGAATTRKTAKVMLQQKREPITRAEKMIVNGYETMQLIAKRKNELLTPQFLLEIHTTITKNTLENEDDVGRFRENDEVSVVDREGSVHHIPPEHKRVREFVEKLCDFANDDENEFIHPIIKASILHFLIGYIHPFNDGNGRTARSIFYWYVLSQDYWLFEYMALSKRILRSRRDYANAYLHTEYDEFDVTYFINYMIRCIGDTLTDLREYLNKKQEDNKTATLISTKLIDLKPRQADMLREMLKNKDKYYTITEISEKYSIVYQTARTDLLYMQTKGYIHMKTQGKKFLFNCDEPCREKLHKTIGQS